MTEGLIRMTERVIIKKGVPYKEGLTMRGRHKEGGIIMETRKESEGAWSS